MTTKYSKLVFVVLLCITGNVLLYSSEPVRCTLDGPNLGFIDEVDLTTKEPRPSWASDRLLLALVVCPRHELHAMVRQPQLTDGWLTNLNKLSFSDRSPLRNCLRGQLAESLDRLPPDPQIGPLAVNLSHALRNGYREQVAMVKCDKQFAAIVARELCEETWDGGFVFGFGQDVLEFVTFYPDEVESALADHPEVFSLWLESLSGTQFSGPSEYRTATERYRLAVLSALMPHHPPTKLRTVHEKIIRRLKGIRYEVYE